MTAPATAGKPRWRVTIAAEASEPRTGAEAVTHDPRLYRCPRCGSKLELHRPLNEGACYEFCRVCTAGFWCACETCETFAALEAL